MWTARIQPVTLTELQKLAVNLGFIVDAPGFYLGDPSPAAMLDALADAYRLDSGAVIDALRVVGVVNRTEGAHDSSATEDIPGS